MYKKITLRRGKEESLLRFHPWVFSGAIASNEDAADGDVVRVCSAEGKFIAVGHYQRGTIAVRVLSFDDEIIDLDFWKRKLTLALRMRQAIGLSGQTGNDTFRLVHGEGDNLPGLIIDCYGRTMVMRIA